MPPGSPRSRGRQIPGTRPATQASADYAVEGASLFGSSFEGRIGRSRLSDRRFHDRRDRHRRGGRGTQERILAIADPAYARRAVLSLRLTVLRCHDIGWSGWWSLVSLVPYAGSLFNLILLIVPGTRGSNDFGRASRPPGVPALATSLGGAGAGGSAGIHANREAPAHARHLRHARFACIRQVLCNDRRLRPEEQRRRHVFADDLRLLRRKAPRTRQHGHPLHRAVP